MKKTIILALFTLAFTVVFAQDIPVSTLKIGPFFVGQKLAEVETLIGKKLNKKEVKTATDDYLKSMKVMYMNAIFDIDFYESVENDLPTFFIQRVTCSDSRLATKSGIKIGANKFELIKKLDEMGLSFEFSKYGELDDNGKSKGTFTETISIHDYMAGKSLTLTIKNNVVVEFTVFMNEGC